MTKRRWIFISITLLVFVAVGTWGGWTLLKNKSDNVKSDISSSSLETEEDQSSKVVHEPASEDIVKLTNDQYENGHDFISEFHDFYNETLCWGRVKTAKYFEQKEKALEIVETIKDIKIDDKDLYEDFVKIENHAKKVTESDDRQAMITLHRLFHDLDVHFNGYSRDDTFGVTAFKGS